MRLPDAEIERLFPNGAASYRLVVSGRRSLSATIDVLRILDAAGSELIDLDARERAGRFVQTIRVKGLTSDAMRRAVSQIERLDAVTTAAVEHWVVNSPG